MASQYYIGGFRFYRRSIIKLSAEERAQILAGGMAVLRRSVEWPLADRIPDFGRAYVDPGGTDIWGEGPYLKVPNRFPEGECEGVNRVFCPYGYPPDQLRIARAKSYLQITAIELEKSGETAWDWLLSVKIWDAPLTPDAAQLARNDDEKNPPDSGND